MTTAVLRYIDPSFKDAGVKPWNKVDIEKMSYDLTQRTKNIKNLRAEPDPTAFNTDTSGFAAYHYPATEKEFVDDSKIRGGYYQEVEEVLRAKLDGVTKVVIFDHTIRRQDKGSPRGPVQLVHVDQTPGAAEVRVRRHVEDPAEAEALLKRRYQIINVWRPIANPATDFPLAVADWRSLSPEDLLKTDLLYPVRKPGQGNDDRGHETRPDPSTVDSTDGYEPRGETYMIAPSEKHQFYYVKDMTPEEVMFIKCFDSRSQGFPEGVQGRAGLTPHTAFVDPATPEGTPQRQSIEVRCLVFY